jgi:magnesium chelatase family protein
VNFDCGALITREFEFDGELALTGELRPIRGALAMTLKAHHDGRAFVPSAT